MSGLRPSQASASKRLPRVRALTGAPYFDLVREGLRDVQRDRLCPRRHVGHHGNDEPAFGKRHEDVVAPMNSALLPWPAIRVGARKWKVSSSQPRP